ncbi:MAG TPA: ATP synthase F0 subunit B [Ilumatobacteraceae bacterium]|nr:ATP synthase F0 subunit B [Ilumatobacteraceae bacterium]
MLTAVVTSSGATIEVSLLDATFVTAEEGSEAEGPESDLNPIFPEVKEVVWGFGAFVVLALAMRLFLYRRVRDGMTARYDRIEGDLETAEASTTSARADVTDYEAQLASVRAEAQTRVEAARATLEVERNEQIAAANGRIADKRAAAAAEVDAAKQAARGQVESAVVDVSTRLTELAAGRRPGDDVVRRAVGDAMNQGVSA